MYLTDKEEQEMNDIVAVSREAEIFRILFMLDEAIKAGKDIKAFRKQLAAYAEAKKNR